MSLANVTRQNTKLEITRHSNRERVKPQTKTNTQPPKYHNPPETLKNRETPKKKAMAAPAPC